MFLAFALMGAIISFFVTRMRRELVARELVIAGLQREQEDRRRLLALATLTGGVAHELATPLGTLSLIGDDLAKALKDDPRWGDDVLTLRQELDRCAAILQRIRQSNSELPGETPQTFFVQEVLDAVREDLSDSERVYVTFEAEATDGVSMSCLQGALAASLLALVKNGVQACSAQGKVALRTRAIEGDIEFIVEDSGEGMSEEVQLRAGEPFFTSKAPGEGMGLGLYLTRLFAMQVRGVVHIRSELGMGTTVSLRVPRTAEV
jgi:two-component system sensor histidine kinase RegB